MNSEVTVLDRDIRGSRITLEMILWIAVGILALVLRLANLGAAPLAAHEARAAMLAWRALAGQGMPEAGYSPFLFVANVALFALCGASDALARLWPALLGGAFVLTPLFFRQRVGRVGTLVAGFYLAISPTALFASRQLDGAVMAALGGAVFFGGGLRFLETGARSWLILATVGLALAVTSSSVFYGMALALGLAWLLFVWGWPAGRLRWLGGLLRLHVGTVVVAFALAVFVFATGLGWSLSGVGAAADLFPAWFTRLGAVSLLPLVGLVVYEPLALLAGLVGWVCLVRRKRRFGVLLGLWVGLGFFVLLVGPPQTPAGAVWIVLPLALLGGAGVEIAVQNWRVTKEWRATQVYVFIASALWIYLYLRFSSYGLKGNPLDLVVGIMVLASPLLLLALAALVFALISRDDRAVTEEMVKGARSALQGAVVSTTAVLVTVTFASGWGVAHLRPADPRELLVHEPTTLEVRALVQTLHDLSWRETGLPTTLDFAYEATPDLVLAWYLRDFGAARCVDNLQEALGERSTVVVTSNREWTPGSPEETKWVGQDFVLSRSWRLSKLSCVWGWPPCNVAFEWLIRRAPTSTDRTGQWALLEPEAVRRAVIWMYQDTTENASHSHYQMQR
jgi:uncharacterized protein (TIGR03663 family)